MQHIAFIGFPDKSDFLLYISKCLTACSKKVLIVDATTFHKYKYSIPLIGKEADKYITNYNGFDIAVNYENVQDIRDYMMEIHDALESYDFILYDISGKDKYLSFSVDMKFDSIYYVMDYEKTSVLIGNEILREICLNLQPEEKVKMTRIIFSSYLPTTDEKYIEQILSDFAIEWYEEFFEIPYDEGDRGIHIQNQYTNKVNMNKLSSVYRETVIEIASLLLGGLKTNFIKNMLKVYERSK